MTSFLLFSLFQLIAQNAIWTFPHQQVKMMQGQFPAVSPIGAGTPVTTVHSYNAIQDDNGNLLFYIVNEELFDNNGVYVSDLLNGNPNSGSFLCLGYPEMCIVPVNDLPTCNKYFIIGGSPNGQNNQSPPYNGITPQWFVYNADTKVLTGNTNNGGGNLIDINGAPNDWFQLNYHFLDMHFAVSKRNCNTGNRLLFMYNGLKLYYSTVSNTSISNATEIPTLVTPQISSNNACEMEVLEKADGTYLLAFFSESVWPNYRINIIHLAANGFTVLNESFVNISEWAYGLEFSPSGKYLYTTIDAPFTTLHYIDLSAVNLTLQALPASNMVQSQFGKSQIELGVDGKLYFFRNASGNLQIPAFLTPENPLSNSWQLSAIPGLNFPFPNGYRGSGILPDQIDGENYYTKGIINSPVTITQTPDIPLCADQYNTATLTATTECPPLSYSWSNGTSIVGITPAIEVNNPGVYTVTLTYQCGYTSTASIQVYNCCEGTYRVDGIKTLSSLTNCPFLTISGNSAVMQNIFNCNSPNDPHPTIAVNGRLIVDMNFDVDGMEFIMGPNSEIVVQYGKIIRNTIPSGSPLCDYFHGCGEYMWRGIYLEGSVGTDNALFFSNTAVYIEDAKHGIWSKDNAKLTVSNVTFNKNNMGILFTPPLFGSSTNTSSITNCKFMCNDKNTLALQTCIRPYLGLRSNTGVKSNDIDFFTNRQ
ncbi:MAG: hypothetical protein IPO27_16945 [Bacteroidetes bacterium]|nr:hypothetical protein [Bacteroidota bacterium]